MSDRKNSKKRNKESEKRKQTKETFLMKSMDKLAPPVDQIEKEIINLKNKLQFIEHDEDQPIHDQARDLLAKHYASTIVARYTTLGFFSALPGVIPGVGTKVQLFIEAGALTADISLMLRWMGAMCMGIGIIYRRDMTLHFNEDLIKIMALWSGVLATAKQAAARAGTKVTVTYLKRMPLKVYQRVHQRVGTMLVTRYGALRGGAIAGRLVPFGIGAMIGGGLNYFIMREFKKAALAFYKNQEDYVINDKNS